MVRARPKALAMLMGPAFAVRCFELGSGLENPLGYFLLTIYILYYFTATQENLDSLSRQASINRCCYTFGLIILVRHDLLLLVLPSLLYLIYRNRVNQATAKWLVVLSLAATPLALWSVFSLIYYGFVFPNTAYAKLNTGVDQTQLITQGLLYLKQSLRADAITLLVIVSAMLVAARSQKKHLQFLAAGLLCNLL